jgi:hypothetical protein
MKTYNDVGEVYFVECSFCGKHSTEVNDYWNDDDELFICDCGHPMFDGWEDEEPEEPTEKTEKPVTEEKIIYVNIKNDTITINGESCNFYQAGLYEVVGDNERKNITDHDIIEEHLIERESSHSNKKVIVVFTDPAENTEETANKKPMPEHVRDYLTFEELSLELQNRIIRTDKLFCQKHGFQQDPSEIRNNLYHKDGSLACMTRKEREDWYTSKEKSKTETVYRYKLSPEWCGAEVWGVSFEHALRRRGKITPNIPGTTKNSLVINQIIETSKTNDFYTATVELEDGRITEVSAVVENSLVLR